MKEKELKIVPPEGYEIDRENSTLECIKFKKKEEEAWRCNAKNIVSGYYINANSAIISIFAGHANTPYNQNIFATKKQAKSALAMAQISQIIANDERFGGVVTDEEWEDINSTKYIIDRDGNEIFCDNLIRNYHFLAFHTKGQRRLFLEENEDLVKDYLMID